MKFNKAFTLIEMLVVIAIIGLLMTILFPSLSEGRQKAKEVLCISSLGQIYNGLISYARENNQNIPRPTNFDTNKHWPRYIYPHISGEEFPQGNVSNYMSTSLYADVMYSPIVAERQRNGEISVNGMGRSDYGLNRYFLGNANTTKQLITAEGRLEPLMMPIHNPSNPSLWYTDQASTAKHAAYFYVGDSKAPGLFINGNVRYISISEGANINDNIWDKTTLE